MGRTKRDRERGATLVEFAFVSTLLFLLVFGIISFGVLLSFKQTVTQAANEAARAAATTEDLPETPPAAPVDQRVQAAENSVRSFEAWGRSCSHTSGGHPNMACVIKVHDCASPLAAPLFVPTQTAALPDCITVRLTYDYGASPIVPNVPLIGAFMPDTVETTATAQLTFPGP